MSIVNGLERYKTYRREDIASLFDPSCSFTAGAGTWGISGIVPVPKCEDVVFMVTLGEPTESNPYQDGVTQDGVLIWQSQKRQSLETKQIQKLISHDSAFSNIHLFLRAKERVPYHYLGLLDYRSHDVTTNNPVHFTWNILHWSLPASVMSEMGLKLLPSIEPTFTQNIVVDPTISLQETEPPVPSMKKSSSKVKGNSGSVDWAAHDARNRSLGEQGEQLVLLYEKEKLKSLGRSDLAELVRHTAITDNAAGYDIQSFDEKGGEIYIEVKTTNGALNTPFYISINEVKTSVRYPKKYWLYRVYDLTIDSALFYRKNGEVEDGFELEASTYKAVAKV